MCSKQMVKLFLDMVGKIGLAWRSPRGLFSERSCTRRNNYFPFGCCCVLLRERCTGMMNSVKGEMRAAAVSYIQCWRVWAPTDLAGLFWLQSQPGLEFCSKCCFLGSPGWGKQGKELLGVNPSNRGVEHVASPHNSFPTLYQ